MSNSTETAKSSAPTIEQLLRLIAGSFILLSLGLGVFHSQYWLLFTAFVGANLLQSGITNWCPMVWILEQAGVKHCAAVETKQSGEAQDN